MIISKEPALRLKPNRAAAASTKTLFTSRDFFLGEAEHRRGLLRFRAKDDPPPHPQDPALQPQPALITPVCVCMCVEC